MFCPQCRMEYREGFVECSDCHVPLTDHLEPEAPAEEHASGGDLDVLIRTACWGPIAIGLAKSLLEEAGIPFFAMDQNITARQESVKARKGPVIAIATEGDEQIARKADDVIYVPAMLAPLFPLLGVIPLQLLAYHIAVARGCDVDKPRNLAKSVTVE